MDSSFHFGRLEMSIAQDRNFLSTLISYFLVLVIYVNLSILQSSVLGVAASILFSCINGIFLGHAFFEKEETFFRLALGVLLLVMLLGFVAWLAVMIYNLDVLSSTLVLLIVTTSSSLLNRRVKDKNAS